MPGDDAPKLSGMKYLVEAILSTGEKDTVMRIGDQGNLGKQYALKVIRRESKEDDVALDCARAAAECSPKLGHPAILRYHDFRLRKAWLFLVKRGELLMEYVNGKSIDQLRDLKISHWALIFREVAVAVAHMHRRGVRHGDITPSHILLSKSGQVKVLGYGLSAVRERNKDAVLGTKAYLAPEAAKEKVLDDRTDVYGLAATMYHMLTGQPVGRRGDGEGGKIATPTALNPRVPVDLNNLIVTCLSSSPARRPEGMYDVQVRLDALVKSLRAEESPLKGLALDQAEA
jgi:serine/threonine-protein kinase